MPTHATVVAFDIWVLLSVLLILCTLVPAVLSKSVIRSPSWYSFMIALLVYSLSYGLIVSRQETPDEPPLVLCVTQTLLIYAVPVLVVSAILNLYIELYLILSGLRSGDFGSQKRTVRSFWLVVTPWLFFVTIITEVALVIFPGGHLYMVKRAQATNFYCHLEYALPTTVTAVILVVTIAGMLLPLQAWLALTTHRSSNTLRRLAKADHQLLIGLYVRLTLATSCAILGMAFSLSACIVLDANSGGIVTMGYPIVAFILAIAFTTQKDILQAWLFWRSSKPCSSILFRVSESRETREEAGLRSSDGSDRHSKGSQNTELTAEQ